MLLFMSKIKKKLTGSGGGAGRSKGTDRSDGESEEGGGELHGGWTFGCWLIWTYGTVRAVVVNSALVHHVRDFPLFFTSGNLPQSKRLVRLRERNKETKKRERSINGLRYELQVDLALYRIVPIKALLLDFSNTPISIYIDSNWPRRRGGMKRKCGIVPGAHRPMTRLESNQKTGFAGPTPTPPPLKPHIHLRLHTI